MGIESIWLGLVRFDSIHTYWRGMCATIQLNSIGCPLGKDSGWKKGLQCIGIFINHNKRYFDKKGEFFSVHIKCSNSGKNKWEDSVSLQPVWDFNQPLWKRSSLVCGHLPTHTHLTSSKCYYGSKWHFGSSVENSVFSKKKHGKSEHS